MRPGGCRTDHPGLWLWEEQPLRALALLKELLGKGREETDGWVDDRQVRHVGIMLLNLWKILLLQSHWEGSPGA